MNKADVEDIYELSPLQSGMLFHTLLEPESKLYFEQVVIPIEPPMAVSACEQAWNHVVEDNTALRTSFHWQQIEKPVQVVHRKARVLFATADLHGLPEERRSARLLELIENERGRGFDLTRAPLLRVTLVQWSATSQRMLVNFHHIIIDGWSMQHVFRQFGDAYQAFARGAVPARRRGRLYGDYIRWLRNRDHDAAHAYWKKKLGDLEAPCLLPPDARASGNPTTFAEHELVVPTEIMARLRELGVEQRLTPNTIVQGAWALLLAQLTGSDDVVFGVTVSGRPAELPDVESMVGMFINTVPLRTIVRHDLSAAAWLRTLQQEQSEARQFDHTPLVQVREAGGFAGRGEMFDTLFAFENYPSVPGAYDGPSASFVERTNYALSAVVVPRKRLEVRLLYRTGVLSEAGVRCIGERYERILEQLGASPDVPLGELSFLTKNDQAAFRALQDTTTGYPRDRTVTDLVDATIAAFPGAIAIEHGPATMTYAELDARANTLAGQMQAANVRPGDRVGLLFERSMDAIASMLAVLRCGAAYVPLDTAYPAARIADILDDTGARVVVAGAGLASRLPQGIDVVLPGTTNSPQPVVRPPLPANARAYVMYTSGSTGKPKGVIVPHRAIVRLVRDTNYIDIAPSDRIGNLSNGAFDAATFEIWGALLNGACIVILDRDTVLSPHAFAREIRKRRVGVMFITAALFDQIVDEAPDAFSEARVVLPGGDALDPRSIRAVLDAGPPQVLGNGYGPTESTTFAVVHHIREVAPGASSIPIGRPISNTTAYVLDPRMRPVPAGATGELWLGGDGLADGYFSAPALTAERFLPDPFSGCPGARMYRTGDRVRWRTDGTIDFLGRFDRQIKLRGFRIDLGEIEMRVLEHPFVARTFVTARNDGSGLSLAAYVVARDGAPPSWANELRSALRRHLPQYMLPAVVPMDALPLNSNGKIDRDALPIPAAAGTSEQIFVAPATETERRLAAIWQQLLGLSRVGVHDDFFHIGGHSLRATQFVSRVRRELGLELPLRAVFEHPTIAELALLLDSGAAAPPVPEASDIMRVSRDKHRIPSLG